MLARRAVLVCGKTYIISLAARVLISAITSMLPLGRLNYQIKSFLIFRTDKNSPAFIRSRMSGRSRAMRAVRYSAWSPRIFKVMLLPCPPPVCHPHASLVPLQPSRAS